MTAWYFAYGSNMQTATLCGRRGVDVHRALPARVSGWKLVFDKPPLIDIGESYANIVPDPTAHVLGVVYEVSAEDLEHIELTEGVRLGNYVRTRVSAQPLSTSAEPMTAITLSSEHRDSRLQPSTRYMELVIDGAIEHGLPDEYVEWLRAVPANPPTPEAVRFRSLMDEALRARLNR